MPTIVGFCQFSSMDEGDLQSMIMMMTRKHIMQCTLPFANELTSLP
jgi:hypothetical protein